MMDDPLDRQRLMVQAASLAHAYAGGEERRYARYAPHESQQSIPMAQHMMTPMSARRPNGQIDDPMIESAYAKLRMNGLADHHVEHEGARRLMQHNPREAATIDGYAQKSSLFQEYCRTIQADCYIFSAELAFLFAAFMTTRISRTGRPVQSIRTYFSAFNYFYMKEGIRLCNS
eukprot:SAG11_NODE_1837_length_4187_cov_4.303082_1_plen_174_part_00